MKTVAVKFLAVLLLASNVAFANGNGATLKVEVIQRKSNVVAVHFQKPEAETVKIKITNPQGEVMYSETVKSHDLAVKKYDLSKLPAGQYTIEVKGGETVYTQSVQVQ